MTSQEILKASLIDIVFDNRNKAYGAYTLRKQYPQRLGIALGIALSSVILILLLAPSFKQDDSVPRPSGEEYELTSVVLPPPPEIPEPEIQTPPASRQQPVAQVRHTDQFRIVTATTNVLPTDDDLRNRNIGLVNIDGPLPQGPLPSLPLPQGGGTGPATSTPGPEKPAEAVSRAARFPGGMEAWTKFLNRHLRTPDELEPGEKKTVLIRFQVGPDGTVTNFEVIQSGGSRFDNEVIRVLKKMPKWEPAMQQGVFIPVSFTQPVTFVGLET